MYLQDALLPLAMIDQMQSAFDGNEHLIFGDACCDGIHHFCQQEQRCGGRLEQNSN